MELSAASGQFLDLPRLQTWLRTPETRIATLRKCQDTFSLIPLMHPNAVNSIWCLCRVKLRNGQQHGAGKARNVSLSKRNATFIESKRGEHWISTLNKQMRKIFPNNLSSKNRFREGEGYKEGISVDSFRKLEISGRNCYSESTKKNILLLYYYYITILLLYYYSESSKKNISISVSFRRNSRQSSLIHKFEFLYKISKKRSKWYHPLLPLPSIQKNFNSRIVYRIQ